MLPANMNFSRIFKVSQIVLPVIALFLASLLFLLAGPDSLKKLDNRLALAQENQQPNLGQPVLTKKLETKIVSQEVVPPQFEAFSILATDFNSDEILYQKNIHTRYPPASTTKLMSALVAQDYFKAADVLTVNQQSLVVGSSMKLRAGEKLTFRSLLYGMLLDSGNDAAFTIAANYPGGVSNFVTQMNLKSEQLGLKDTKFQDPAGYDNPDQYSSAYDLSKIAKAAAQDNQIARIVSTKQTTILSWNNVEASASSHVVHNLKNLNLLLNEDGVLGMKTGTTEKAGENLVGLVERDGQKILTITLGSKDRYKETKNLIDWIYNNYDWVLE